MLGKKHELLIGDLLDKKGYSYKRGHYAPNKQNEQGECDFILETDKRILFIEAKNCGLPSGFECADTVTVLNSLGKNVLEAQEQVLRHKLHLAKNNNKMKLYNDVNDDSTSCELHTDDKRIYSISLSSTEYAFLTAGNVANKLFESLIYVTYNTHEKTREKEFKKLNDLAAKIKKIAEDYAKIKGKITGRDLSFNTSFKSLQQFWVTLNNSSSFEDFVDNFIHDKYIMSALDYYVSLKSHIDMRKQAT